MERIKLPNCLQMDPRKSPLNLKIGVSSCDGNNRFLLLLVSEMEKPTSPPKPKRKTKQVICQCFVM